VLEFSTVIWIVVVVVAPVAAVLFSGAFGLLDQLGRGGLAIDEPRPVPGRPASPRPGGPLARAEREAEIRQLVQARHDRQAGRGEQAVDVEAEVGRLLALDPERSPTDAGTDEHSRQEAALRLEVRQLVIARNERRASRGEPPLDVEAEVERQLADLS
jgi:hypothetical protein